jgi:nicotinate phosphoribosyltransferase
MSLTSKVEMFCDPFDPSTHLKVDVNWGYRDLLIPIMRAGELVYTFPGLKEIRDTGKKELDMLPASMKRFLNPQSCIVGLEGCLLQAKLELIKKYKG